MRPARPRCGPRASLLVALLGLVAVSYGADLALPKKTTRVTLSVGATTMRVMPSAADRFSRRREVSFDWPPEPTAVGSR